MIKITDDDGVVSTIHDPTLRVGMRVSQNTKFGLGVLVGMEVFDREGSFTEKDPTTVNWCIEEGTTDRLMVRVDDIPSNLSSIFPNNILAFYVHDDLKEVV